MQTISDELKASLAKKNPTYKKVVELHRQLWSGGVYIYDTEIDVTNQVKQYGSVRWKFDNEDFNTWTLDNTSLVFRNDRNQWKQDNAKGYFPDPYLIAESKIVIKFGAELADGTFEVIKSFTGYIAGDPIADPSGKSVTVTIQGGMAAFGKKSAEEISTLVTDELLGENAGTEFTTDYNGVGIIVIVKRGVSLAAATEIKPVTDYTASDLNQKTLPLKITLVTDLTAGEKLYISYRYWYQNKTLEWLAEQVMILCGVTSYSIAPAVFSSSIENTWDFDSQADWEACALTNIGTKAYPGSFQRKWFLIDDFADGNYTSNPAWTVSLGAWTVAGNILRTATPTTIGKIFIPFTKTVGTWQYIYKADASWYNAQSNFFFMLSNDESNGYRIHTYREGYTSQPVIYRLMKIVGGVHTAIGQWTGGTDINFHTVRITRDSNGLMNVYIDGTLRITATNNEVTTSNRLLLSGGTGFGDGYTYFDDIYFSDDVTTDVYESDNPAILISIVNDAGVDITSWGKLTATYTDYGETVLIETAVSGDDISYDAWIAISETGQILSAVKRYIKFRVKLTTSFLNAIPITPIVDRIVIKYYTSTTVIDLVNLTGMTCKQVMERLAEMPAYEIGFKADETFVYRPRFTTVPPVMDLRSDTNIENISNITDGVERVKNRVVAEFGIYRVVADASADAQPNSIDKYETREYSVSASNLLPAQNVNIAYAIAPTILSYTKTPRKRCTVETMFLPHLELGDKVTLYFNEPTALYRWLYGDTDMPYGRVDLEYYDEDILKNRYNFWGTVARVEGLEFDPNTFQTKINLVEVL